MNTENIKFENGRLEILDQTLLPNEIKYIEMRSIEDCYDAIKRLAVRGAPAIGIFAGYAIALFHGNNPDKNADYLISSRPTAVNLSWAVKRVLNAVKSGKSGIDEAIAIHKEDIEMCRKISEFGLSLLNDGDGILTHCNAGELATSKYGTGLGPLILGKEKGYNFHAFVDETRPLLQGARLTSFELHSAGITTTLQCDNMASQLMKSGKIDIIFVGCDRVAANGDAANKIGTSGLAILARHYGIPFYVCAPSSTIDLKTATGEQIPIEMREPDEVTQMWYKERMAPEGIEVFNPAFDVTDHSLITGMITEKGLCTDPYGESFREIGLC